MHVLLTCPPDLLCNLGLFVSSDDRADPAAQLDEALASLADVVLREGTDRFAVLLPDPVDAVIAMRTLATLLPEVDVELMSFVASAAACELLLEPREPAHGAWLWLASRLAGPRPDPRAGCCFVSHFDQPIARPVPPAIADQRLPRGPGLLLWSVAGDPAIELVDRSPYPIGPDDAVQLERAATGWLVRRVAGGFHVDNQPGGLACELQPGMVIQLARPHAFVVLAVH